MRTEKEQRVIQAATDVFLRYGFKRTTMGDLAAAAGLSRPALYLLFCNKERIFEASLEAFADATLEEIRTGLRGAGSPMDKLRLAFELWAIRPFQMLQGSPDARDLLRGDPPCAGAPRARASATFEELLAAVLAEFPNPPRAGAPGLAQTARVLAVAVHGFKEAARSTEELRAMIDDLLHLTLAALAR